MSEKKYYDSLWNEKEVEGRTTFHEKRDWFHRSILDKILDPFSNNRGDISSSLLLGGEKILDLGIWGGDFLNRSEVKSKFTQRYGLDITSESVERALLANVKAQVWNLNHVPYPYNENFFDAVTALAVIEHIFDPIEVMKEINRILKLNGQVIVALPNIVSFSNRVRVLFGYPPVTSLDPGWDGGHLHNFTIPTTKQLFQESGFVVTGLRVTGSGQKLRMVYPKLLAGEFILCGRKVKDT
jgi:SAM-dependent methyltransferase